MIESYNPNRVIDQTSNMTESRAVPFREMEVACHPEGPSSAAQNLGELRKIQYETLERLCLMHDDLAGAVAAKEHQELCAKFQEEVQGLVNLTAFVCAQSRAIGQLVEECRAMIGA